MKAKLAELKDTLKGTLHDSSTMRKLYATDASVYRELPLAVALPECEDDILQLIKFANANKCGLIPRTAGTSLAGQVVGSGIVIDVSKHFTEILEVNVEEKWVRVQPGVIRNELNTHLKPYGLFFGPETSTQNRAMMGGMVGNNSCGSNSIAYGTTRDHLLEAKGFLADGARYHFTALSKDAFLEKAQADDDSLETKLYRQINDFLSQAENRTCISEHFPNPSIHRRNTGYAIDALMQMNPFSEGGDDFNFCKLLAGSEGTLSFLTEVKLNLLPLPATESGLICIHFNDVDEALRANLIALKYQPLASELIDHYILECTKKNIGQQKNRFFVEGDPGAILVVELSGKNQDEVTALSQQMEAELRAAGLGHHFPILFGEDSHKVWELRKAGLGLLSNIPGDAKPVALIEDAAVDVRDLPEYIKRVNIMLHSHGLSCVHYAHAGSGEIHIRPILDLKSDKDRKLFRTIGEETAALVKEFNGSLSGEHGDGRLRGEFLERMIGEQNFDALKQLKKTWDPHNIFNPGKITDAPPMDQNLRYEAEPAERKRKIDTIMDFSQDRGILRAAEMCNGSGDCRKTQLAGGTMCPSYMATRDEKDTTRARANILREALTNSQATNPFDNEEIKEVMDLCLSCKACKSECPSSVDMTKLKAEFLQHYHDANGVPLRSRLIAHFADSARIASFAPWLYNAILQTPILRRTANRLLGFHPERSMPRLNRVTLRRWFRNRTPLSPLRGEGLGRVHLFCDEFTNFNDLDAGIATVELLELLGYEVHLPDHNESGRASLSKGLVRRAKRFANENVRQLSPLVSTLEPLIGIEPSAILGFRDEYPALVDPPLRETARQLAAHCLLLDEFITREADAGRIDMTCFTREPRSVVIHGHCHQKALASTASTLKMLSLPENFSVREIPSGCCGMAGSFGYEHEHYKVSVQIGELVLLPAVRALSEEDILVAAGTSCRHQIHDGAARSALHPAQVLRTALVGGVPSKRPPQGGQPKAHS